MQEIKASTLMLIRGLHISHVQHRVLVALNGHKDRCKDVLARDLAAETGLNLRLVVGALRRLEDRKMVRRTSLELIPVARGYNETWRWQALIAI